MRVVGIFYTSSAVRDLGFGKVLERKGFLCWHTNCYLYLAGAQPRLALKQDAAQEREAVLSGMAESTTTTGCLGLTPGERAKLANILARLASSFGGERAAAGQAASLFLTKHGLGWSDLISHPQATQTASADAEAPSPARDRRRGRNTTSPAYCRRQNLPLGLAVNQLM